MRMLNAMSVFSRTVDERVGWKRIAIAINILVIAAAFFILFRLLRNIDIDKVLAAIQAMSLQTGTSRDPARRDRLCHSDVL